jgi:hypothetical protein
MGDLPLIEAVKRSDHVAAAALLAAGHDVHESGEQAWPALNFAAGKGDREMVALLLRHGADPFKTGADQRTPYQIAVAAAHFEVARDLRAREEQAGGDRERVSNREWETRPYCRAYPWRAVRDFPGWAKHGGVPADVADDAFVFVHADHALTRSFWRDRDLLLAGDAADWRAFCEERLGFRVPRELDE